MGGLLIREGEVIIRLKIQRTLCLFHGPARDATRVNHGRPHIAVAKELLDGADVVVRLKQMRGKAVAEGIGRDVL